MQQRQTIILIDSDFRRRAAISHCLAGTSIHVEPFEDLAELNHRWPREGMLLVHDDGDVITRAIERMTEAGQWLPLVAFSTSPGTNQVVQAVLAGAEIGRAHG